MNDLEPKTPATPETDGVNPPSGGLQRQMTTMLVALVIVSCTLTVFLWRQARYARYDLNALRPTAAQIFKEFNQKKPGLQAFVAKIAEYGRSHPDFAPIMNKYKLSSITGAPPTTVTAPKPAATPEPKK
jgi:hypothetical protein